MCHLIWGLLTTWCLQGVWLERVWGNRQGLSPKHWPRLMQLVKNGECLGQDVGSGNGETQTDARPVLETELSGPADLFIQFINSTFPDSVDMQHTQ